MRATRVMAACVVAAIALGGCVKGNGVKVEGLNQGMGDRFEYEMLICSEGEATFGKVIDTETGITYLVMRSGHDKYSWGGITPLLNRDGTPVIDGRFE